MNTGAAFLIDRYTGNMYIFN